MLLSPVAVAVGEAVAIAAAAVLAGVERLRDDDDCDNAMPRSIIFS
jgi:hypothetical protein